MIKFNNYKKEGTNNSFYRKSGGDLDIGSGIAAIKEVRGKSIVWNQRYTKNYFDASVSGYSFDANTGIGTFVGTSFAAQWKIGKTYKGHKYYIAASVMSSEVSPSTRLALWGLGKYHNIYFTQTTWKRQGAIETQRTDYPNLPWQIVDAVEGVTYYIKNPVLIDLTIMFGAGNEPATVAEFEKMFPLDYYDYNEGEVIPFAGQNLTTIGKNQYNPTSGKANLLGGQTYQLLGTYTSATIDGVAVTLDSNNCFTTTKDCVLDVAGGNDTDTIVALYNGENVTYEPYEKHTLSLDPSQWRDKQGNLVFPYGGMHGYGSAYDYAKVDADGYIRRAVRCFEQVDLGTIRATQKQSPYNRFLLNILSGMKRPSKNLVSTKYRGGSANYANGAGCCETLGDGYLSVNEKDINGTLYSTTADFTAAMQGVMLYYELTTPVEVELATPIYAKYLVDKDGTEEITPANGTTPYTTEPDIDVTYNNDVAKIIRGDGTEVKKVYKGTTLIWENPQ